MDIEQLIESLNFLKEYIEERKFNEKDTNIQGLLLQAESSIPLTIMLLNVFKNFSEYLNILTKLN